MRLVSRLTVWGRKEEGRERSPMDNLAPRIQRLVTRLSGRAEPGPALPLDRAAAEAGYRQAILRWFELTAHGPAAHQAEVDQVHQEILRMIDDVGEPRATRLRRQWAREWWQETGVCPFCGERGPFHNGDGEAEATNA